MNHEVSNPASEMCTLVIGIGNPLHSDDGLGVRVAQQLAAQELPPGVKVEELGTPGWSLVNHLQGWQRVLLIDAVQMGERPGTWHRLDASQTHLITQEVSVSLHEPGLAESLALAQALNLMPDEVAIYGVEPAWTGAGMELSPEIQEAIPSVVENILQELWKTK